ncbi:MAG: prephenate dehydrogenase/arogenate dehydrogenase family protein [Dehalococcoidia bacterium]
MAKPQIAIIGTGLIGTSIGLVLAGRPNRGYEVIGIDRSGSRARTAKKMGALDRTVGSLEEAVRGTSIVILAVPVRAARRLMEDMVPYLEDGAIVMDTCSSKQEIMQWAAELLPATANFVGTHPMAGKEASGPGAADASLFRGAPWAIMPSPRADESAVQVVHGLIEQAGATPLYVDPAEHDTYVAAVSHMLILVSVSLFRTVRDSAAWEDASLLAGPAFRDLTRLASGDPTMGTDIIATNRDAILHWLGRFRDEIGMVMRAVEVGDETVYDLLARTQLDREVFLDQPRERRRKDGPEVPGASDAMGTFLMGGALYEKMKQIQRAEPVVRDTDELRRKLGMDGKGDR